MFLVDISPSMGKLREIEVPSGKDGELDTIEITNLELALQFVMLKIQEMIYNGRKTDQCGVITFGSEETDNIIHEKHGGYENVSEYIPIGQPNAGTLAKLARLQPSTVIGDPIDALIVGIETQHQYLSSKKTWTRKMVLLTDGENPIEVEDWEATVHKMNTVQIHLTVVGVDFDDEYLPFLEEGKSNIKRANEEFYHTLAKSMAHGIVGNCDFALQELSRPDIKQTKSALLGTVLRIGDVDARPEEAMEILVKTSKATAIARPKSWKKFARRQKEESQEEANIPLDEETEVYAQLHMRTQYMIEKQPPEGEEDQPPVYEQLEGITKEELVRGFKYGSSYAPCPGGQFERLPTRRGIDICGFFLEKNFRREWEMSEVTYVWADPAQPLQQVALSAVVQAMYEKGAMAIARWASRDGMDPKMGVLRPTMFEKADCFMWVQMPFADDVRNFSFASLETLINKKGEVVTDHPYLPTDEQMEAMEHFVDAMDLMDAGEKDEEGNREPWFDTRLSYNPVIHRTKQAQFHAAIVADLNTHPLPPAHSELTKYFEPPKRVLKRSRDAIEECKQVFKIKEVPKRVVQTRKDGHVRAGDEDEDMILLDKMPRRRLSKSASQFVASQQEASTSRSQVPRRKKSNPNDSATESETEDEDEELLLDKKQLPTPVPDADEGSDAAPTARIVGTESPLEDFKDNISRGDLVTKAVEDLGAVIKEIVLRPFSARRTEEMLQCMQELRKVCLEEDEVDAWNAFLPDLRQASVEKSGDPDFWLRVRDLGRAISLISSSEASSLGGKSDISETNAVEFIQG